MPNFHLLVIVMHAQHGRRGEAYCIIREVQFVILPEISLVYNVVNRQMMPDAFS
jgi:hypothetical protein